MFLTCEEYFSLTGLHQTYIKIASWLEKSKLYLKIIYIMQNPLLVYYNKYKKFCFDEIIIKIVVKIKMLQHLNLHISAPC